VLQHANARQGVRVLRDLSSKAGEQALAPRGRRGARLKIMDRRRRSLGLFFCMLAVALAYAARSAPASAQSESSQWKLTLDGGALNPTRESLTTGIDNAPHLSVGLAKDISPRFAFGGRAEFVGWDSTRDVNAGLHAVSGVWRGVGFMQYRILPTRIAPFVSGEAGLARYVWTYALHFDDVGGIHERRVTGLTPTVGARVGLAMGQSHFRVMLGGEWFEFLGDDLPASIGWLTGIEIGFGR